MPPPSQAGQGVHAMRHIDSFSIQNSAFWKTQLLHWAAEHTIYMCLDNNAQQRSSGDSPWNMLLGVGAAKTLELPAGTAFESLKRLQEAEQDWLFGGFGYDLKNEVEALNSRNLDGVMFPDLVFFQPETVVILRDSLLEIQTRNLSPTAVFDAIQAAQRPTQKANTAAPNLLPRISKAKYLETVEAIRQHIIEGDLYEMNLCQEFYAENASIDPLSVWKRLNNLSKAPLAAFFRWHDRYLLSASPERFLKKEGQKLISQPIKGTRKRLPGNDEAMRAELAASEKDRAENVMIVDLVRNDLARSCKPGTVIVEELFGIHTFETVHQMISTVSGELLPRLNAIDALRYAFPPGSMTGAPKVMAMELIEQYEYSRRGLYAGALGYFEPAGNFDFNVLIRSILYNESRKYISFQVGGAIVYDSIPEEEYEECLVKASALFAALAQN